MDTITATVTGARHLRVARNGQDAAAAASGAGWTAAVVCDGCSAGASSEVGARLGAALALAAIVRRLAAGEPVGPDLWGGVRRDVIAALAAVADRMGDDRVRAVVDHFLFTIVAVAATRERAEVWAIGDGTYAFGDGRCAFGDGRCAFGDGRCAFGDGSCASGDATRQLGPFADNQPPYLGYALLGDDPPAHVEAAPVGTRTIAIGTDGALELDGGLARFTEARYLEHADRARRELAVLARGREVIEWDARRVVRTAELHDDCAIAVVRVP